MEKALAELRASKAERPVAIAENRAAATDYFELDGWDEVLSRPLEEN